jgi:hypothetical protein
MTPAHPANAVGGAGRDGDGPAAAPGMAHWLSLAAAPTFATMALLTAVFEGADMICAVSPDAWPFGGMVPMYLLMSAFHLPSWLRLMSGGPAQAGCDPTSRSELSRG